MRPEIEEKLKQLPNKPGVYLMRDVRDDLIYVGKAKSLTKRVHQYFQPSHDEGIKKQQMVERIHRFEFIVCDTELEALVLENNFIKEYHPKYNTMLRDDKTYPYIKVTVAEAYPRVLFCRRVEKDGARYFGPFPNAGAVHETIDLVQKLFLLRTCNRPFPRDIGKERPCLNYHMGQCKGVCLGELSEEDYRKQIEGALTFLNGDDKAVLADLKAKMKAASEAMEFEKAAGYRDLIKAVGVCMNRQKVTNFDNGDKDIVALAQQDGDALAQIFFIRGGKMIGREHFFMNVRIEEEAGEIMAAFLQQYYAEAPLIPREIYISIDIPSKEPFVEWLGERRGGKVYLHVPKRGDKNRLVKMAEKNAQMVLDQDKERLKREEGRTIGAMKEIASLLGIPGIMRMEAYDISNTNGFESVGSMVVFDKGKPLRNAYRKFKIRSVTGPNDYASMKEVLTRRFSHGLKERDELSQKGRTVEEGSFTQFPDIIMMDGGKGQVNIALEVLDELGLQIPVAGMVKDDHHRTRGLYYQNVERMIDHHSEGFKLITRLQDEAHRFAITYHKSLRGKAQVHSFLDDVTGIGPTRRRNLMKRFASVEEMRAASVEELAAVDGMDVRAAQSLYDFLHPKREDNPVGKH
ncbi:MAG: excinuclease ABC subunit UvrC [Lachnospiraceae bacterium]|nr:excinuclease ABC subunit UvrC [Lachnospiraceae bacterium]